MNSNATAQQDGLSRLHPAQCSVSGRLLYVYTYLYPNEEWRVFEALMIRADGSEVLMVVVDEWGAIHYVKEAHIDARYSAHYFVHECELARLISEVEADWNKRHCWRLAFEDSQRLKMRIPNIRLDG